MRYCFRYKLNRIFHQSAKIDTITLFIYFVDHDRTYKIHINVGIVVYFDLILLYITYSGYSFHNQKFGNIYIYIK